MDISQAVEELKKLDENYYNEVLTNHTIYIKDEKKLNEFVARADQLLDRIRGLLTEETPIEYYNWLTRTALKWQVIYSSTLNIPRDIKVFPESLRLKTPAPTRVFTEEDLEEWLKQKAYSLSLSRKLNYLLKEAEKIQQSLSIGPSDPGGDWHQAQVEFAAQVIGGEINFARQLAANLYPRLEEVWLREVKLYKAYSIWERKGGGWDTDTVGNYLRACEQIRRMLVEPEVKQTARDYFGEAKAYIETNFLDRAGRLDPEKSRFMRETRAREVWASCGSADSVRNHHIAENYLRLFYENIIPAVVKDDPEHTLLTLKAFQYARTLDDRCRLVNCFEVALAVYFLNADHVNKFWDEADHQPAPGNWEESVAELPSPSPGFVIPAPLWGRLRLDEEGRRLFFKGVMTEAQRDALLRQAPPDLAAAIEQLFTQSRLLPRAMTL